MERFVDTGLQNAALAVPLALVAFSLCLIIRRPAARHALWLIVLLRLLMPALWEITIPRPATMQASRAVAKSSATEPDVSTGSMLGDKKPHSADRDTLAADGQVQMDLPTLPVAGAETETSPPTAELTARKAQIATVAEGADGDNTRVAAEIGTSMTWRAVLGWIWLATSGIACSIFCCRLLQFAVAMRFSRPASEAIQFQTERVGRRLGLRRVPRAYLVDARVSPMLFGIGSCPRLVIPAALWSRLDLSQRSALLAHELAHYRRGDHLVRGLELIASIFFWWHPVLWLARWQIRETEEQCCDAWVVWALPYFRRDYATAIVDTIGFLSEGRNQLPALASGVGEVRCLQRRLTMIMRDNSPRRSPPVVLAAIVMIGLAFVTLGTAWGEDPLPQEPRERPRTAPPASSPERDLTPDDGTRSRPGSQNPLSQDEANSLRRELEQARADFNRARKHIEDLERRLRMPGEERRPVEPGLPAPREGAGRNIRLPKAPGMPDQPLEAVPRGRDRAPEHETRNPQPGVPGAGPTDRGSLEQRMQMMERQLHEMLRQMEEMRRSMDRGDNRRRPDDPNAPRPDLPGRERRETDRPGRGQEPNAREVEPSPKRGASNPAENLGDPIRP